MNQIVLGEMPSSEENSASIYVSSNWKIGINCILHIIIC